MGVKTTFGETARGHIRKNFRFPFQRGNRRRGRASPHGKSTLIAEGSEEDSPTNQILEAANSIEEEWAEPINNDKYNSRGSLGSENAWGADFLYVCSVLNCRSESEGGIVVDSGATSSVCGENWIAENVDKPIRWQESSNKFRFGDGEVTNSVGSVIICVPIMVEENIGTTVKTAHIRRDAVRSKLPLLLSKAALAKMKDPIDFDSNALWMGGKHRAQLLENTAGHAQIPVGKGKFRSIPMGKPTQIILTADEDENHLTVVQLAKIHLQLSHCAKEVLLGAIKNAGRECSVREVDKMYRDCGCALSRSKMGKPARMHILHSSLDIRYSWIRFTFMRVLLIRTHHC